MSFVLGWLLLVRNGRLGDDAGVGDRVGLPLHGLGEGLVEALVNLSVRLCRRLKLVERRGLFGRPGRLLADGSTASGRSSSKFDSLGSP